jgi:sugar phosphate permease
MPGDRAARRHLRLKPTAALEHALREIVRDPPVLALACIGAAGFLLLGPYSLLGGCLALDYGGKRAAATAAGINDGVGYVGGSASGLALGGIAQTYGWGTAFLTLAACGAVSCVVALVFYFTAERQQVRAAVAHAA